MGWCLYIYTLHYIEKGVNYMKRVMTRKREREREEFRAKDHDDASSQSCLHRLKDGDDMENALEMMA